MRTCSQGAERRKAMETAGHTSGPSYLNPVVRGQNAERQWRPPDREYSDAEEHEVARGQNAERQWRPNVRTRVLNRFAM